MVLRVTACIGTVLTANGDNYLPNSLKINSTRAISTKAINVQPKKLMEEYILNVSWPAK